MANLEDGESRTGACVRSCVIAAAGKVADTALPISNSPRVCAVNRRRSRAGASPARQPLQPEATGADMDLTKWLKRASSKGWLDQQEVDLPGQ